MASQQPAYKSPQALYGQPQPHVQGQALQQSLPPRAQNGLGSSRRMARTPSPTPSERKELEGTRFFDWRGQSKWTYVLLGLVIIVLIVFAALHNTIIKHLQPAAQWVHNLKDGWLIPVAILFVMSFPPLFGAEFIAVMCGVVWGNGIGFAIVAVGQFLGELANFFVFKYSCRSRSEKIKKSSIRYACLGEVIEDGGLQVAIIARYSAIPTHATTALFATCGMSVWTFIISAIVSLPKNFVNVYIGSTFESEAQGTSNKKSRLINVIVTVVTVAITIFAMRYITARINAVKPDIIYRRRKARQNVPNFDQPAESSTIELTSYPPAPIPEANYSAPAYNV